MLLIYGIIALWLPCVFASLPTRRDGDLTPCAAGSPSNYTDADGFTYNLTCSSTGNQVNTDVIYSITGTSFAACMQLCSDYNIGKPTSPCTGIVASSANSQSGIGYCYLKNAMSYSFDNNTNYDTAIVASVPEPLPTTPSTYTATCPGDDRQFYTNSFGISYQLFCDHDVRVGNQLADLQANSYDQCAGYCSAYVGNNAPCSVFTFDGSECILYAASPLLYDNSGINVGLLTQLAKPCTINGTTTANYTLAEGDTFYNKGLLYASDVEQLLQKSTQPDPCECLEQCAFWNREHNGTEGVSPCMGIEFSLNTDGDNCLVKSN